MSAPAIHFRPGARSGVAVDLPRLISGRMRLKARLLVEVVGREGVRASRILFDD